MMSEEEKGEGKSPSTDSAPAKKPNRMISRKTLAVIIAVILVSASIFTVWYFYFRHWSASELADKMVRYEGGGYRGFESGLAGRSVIVEGRVTAIESQETTIGNVTIVELDDVAESSLVFWNTVSFEIGDRIERKISFEWSYWNEDRSVFSPEVWLPFGYAYGLSNVMNSVSYVISDGGVLSLINDGNNLRIEIEWLEEPVSLDIANCTVVAGSRSGYMDYGDLQDYSGEKNATDSIDNLTHEVGWNQTIEFSDENADGYLDNGDSFILKNLRRPDTQSGIRTYMFHVDWPRDSDMDQHDYIHGLWCYIPVLADGAVLPLLWTPPVSRGSLGPDDGARTLTIDYIDRPIPWENITILLFDGTNFAKWEPTVVNPLAESLGIKELGLLEVDANITHTAGNGIVSAGDRVTVSVADSGVFPTGTYFTLSILDEELGESIIRKTFNVNDTPKARLEPYLSPPGWPIDGVGFTFTQAHVGINNTYSPFDLSWNDVIVNLTDGVNNVSWTTSSSSLHLGFGAGACFDNLTLGSVKVQLCVYDLNGDGQVNNGDRLELWTPDVSGFSSSTTYSATAIYSHTGTVICSANFTG